MSDPVATFLEAVEAALHDGTFGRLVLGKPAVEDTLKWVVRPVALKAGLRYQGVERRPGADRTANLTGAELLERIRAELGVRYQSGHLFTDAGTLQLEWRKSGPVLSHGSTPVAPDALRHDRDRRRVLDLDARWTSALELTDPTGRPLRGSEAKVRQVHRFVEVFSHAVPNPTVPADRPFRVVDVGCGRGTLTFAAWQYLRGVLPEGTALEVVGIELRPALAEKVEGIARRLGCEGLSFRAGTIEAVPEGEIDVVIALHACDTATDDALAVGQLRHAKHLFVAPCCHKELRSQLVAPPALSAALRHGILRTREADLATDALRAALLEVGGYDARVFEFVSTEHTDKNLMISAVRRPAPRPEAAAEARSLAAFFGIRHQSLADRMGFPLTEVAALAGGEESR